MNTFKWLRFIPLAVLVWMGAGCNDSVTDVPPPPEPPQLKLDTFGLHHAKDHRLPDNDVFDVFVDSQDRVWIATDQGVAMKEVGADVVTFDDFDGIPNRKCRTLIGRGNKVFVGTWGGGIAYWDGNPMWTALPIKEGNTQGIIDAMAEANMASK